MFVWSNEYIYELGSSSLGICQKMHSDDVDLFDVVANMP
jgi:hypothetical protein